VGRIDIGRLGVSAIMLGGTTARTLRRAVGHISGTALPGESVHVGRAGHRDTCFRALEGIMAGDTITLTSATSRSGACAPGATPGPDTRSFVRDIPRSVILSGVIPLSLRRTMSGAGAQTNAYSPASGQRLSQEPTVPPMQNRMTITPWPAQPDQRPPLAGTSLTMRATRVGAGVGATGLCETWRGWEAGTSSEFLNWFLFTPHERSSTGDPAVAEDWICFNEDRSALDGRARAILGDRLELLRANPTIRIVIGGLAGRRDSIARGMRLGLRRILAIRTFLVDAGIDPDRIGIAVRGPGWSVTERSAEPEDSTSQGSECRLQVTDPLWTLARN
jgi:outer membrane protein OmpA-like peptidoglycan-associated protein